MSTTTRLLVVHARSPLHAGTGQSTAAVDLPIARDRATGLPLLPGSSIKGSLRARAAERLPDRVTTLFGPETENASAHAGGVAFSDARLLLLPVRSVAGTFAWATSPWLLAGLARDARLVDRRLPRAPGVERTSDAVVTKGSLLAVDLGVAPKVRPKVVLEEFDLDRREATEADAWAEALGRLVFPDDEEWRKLLGRRLCIVHDDVMSFLAQHATDLVTRVSIDPATGTAREGQLWTEENLPSETVLIGLAEEVPTGRERRPARVGGHLDEVQALLAAPIQLGGKATVGRGRCQLHLVGGA